MQRTEPASRGHVPVEVAALREGAGPATLLVSRPRARPLRTHHRARPTARLPTRARRRPTTPPMSLRTFTDDDDIVWEVWDVIPRGPAAMGTLPSTAAVPPPGGATHVAPPLREGWLTFRTAEGEARRRLSPIPAGWADAPAVQLVRWCALALPVTPRRA